MLLVNSVCFDNFPSFYYKCLLALSSDYRPMLVKMQKMARSKLKPFRFFNDWIE